VKHSEAIYTVLLREYKSIYKLAISNEKQESEQEFLKLMCFYLLQKDFKDAPYYYVVYVP